jgi:formate hydrogenlyase subunit 6/NADH:ubiquinone oxidoreductase subunit I
MFAYFKLVFNGARGLVTGLGVTLRHLFMPSITVQYPHEKLTLSDRFRGALAFHPEICISCEMCVRACPSACISLESKRNEETKKKDLSLVQNRLREMQLLPVVRRGLPHETQICPPH